jgi:DamX protein
MGMDSPPKFGVGGRGVAAPKKPAAAPRPPRPAPATSRPAPAPAPKPAPAPPKPAAAPLDLTDASAWDDDDLDDILNS